MPMGGKIPGQGTPFAQSCPLATRLVATGVRFVTVSFGN
jgi:hypothetical protein